MVDFNNEATVATPANDVIRILILQRRNDFIEAFEHYEKLRFLNPDNDDSSYKAPVRARLRSLYRELQASLKRTIPTAEYHDLRTRLFSDNITEIESAFETINEWLDKKKLVRVDNKPDYDTSDVVTEDELEGL